MNIFIAFDYSSTPLGLVLATDKSYAQVAFEAMGPSPHHIEEIDPEIAIPGDVFYILTSTESRCNSCGTRHWHRGK